MKAIAYDIMSYRNRDHPCWRNSRIGRDLKPEGICKKINRKTKGLLPVHFAGRPCEMSEILSLPHGLRTVEDCAHASETMYHGSHAGTFGDCGVLSFYSTKNLPTGDGGMILTDDDSLAAWFKLISQQGVTTVAWQRLSAGGYRHYDVAEIGFKYNMMDLQAAIGIHQLRRLERPLAVLALDRHCPLGGQQHARKVGGRIPVGERPADRSPVADLRVGDRARGAGN